MQEVKGQDVPLLLQRLPAPPLSPTPNLVEAAGPKGERCATIPVEVAELSLRLKVECYAGYRADERPLRFTPQATGGRTYEVKEILDRWYGIGYRCFKVRADDNNLYVLRHNEEDDVWTLDSFRRAKQ
jgi:hypothetical protein